jgi:hypothetical protein
MTQNSQDRTVRIVANHHDQIVTFAPTKLPGRGPGRDSDGLSRRSTGDDGPRQGRARRRDRAQGGARPEPVAQTATGCLTSD